jgi:hypothetical protein
MQEFNLEDFCDLLAVVTIEQTILNGPTMTSIGHVAGQRTVAVSHMNGNGYVIQ